MSDNTSIHNPHDRLFKKTFSRKESAIGFLKGYLPADVTELIDFNSLEQYPGSYIDDTLREHASDLVYKVNMESGSAYLYVLFEHQSTPEPLMAYRLLKYAVNLWENIFKEQPELKQLPPVIPLVLYQGQADWNISRQFHDLISVEQDGLKRFLPRFEYLLVDLPRQDHDHIYGDLVGRLTLLAMRAVVTYTTRETLANNLAIITELWRRGDIIWIETAFRYIMSTDNTIEMDAIQQIVNQADEQKMGDTVMTIAEKLRAEGQAKGHAQGLTEGEIRLLKAQLSLKFPDAPPVNLEGLSLEQLETIGRRLLTCNTLDEVLQGIR